MPSSMPLDIGLLSTVLDYVGLIGIYSKQDSVKAVVPELLSASNPTYPNLRGHSC